MPPLAHQLAFDYPRPRRVAQALAALWVLALADLVLTIWAHVFTPLIEMNPLADAILGMGFGALIAFKLATTLTGSTIFWYLRHDRRCEILLWGLVGVYVLLAIRWADYTHSAVASVNVSAL